MNNSLHMKIIFRKNQNNLSPVMQNSAKKLPRNTIIYIKQQQSISHTFGFLPVQHCPLPPPPLDTRPHSHIMFTGAFSSNVWNWNFKLSKNQLNHSIFFYLCAERRIFLECVCLMAARHRYLFLRYALLNQTTLNMQNNSYVTRYTFTFLLIP